MHGNRASATALVNGLLGKLPKDGATAVVLFPPFVHLDLVADLLTGSPVRLGGQTLSEHEQGAYTGEISGSMLREAGCDYVLVGHSERRSLYGETDETVAAKFEAALASGLTPVLCVGESLDEREADQTTAVVERQLDAVLSRCGVESLGRAIVAYEPVWAIGTGKTATPAQAQEVHAAIRARVATNDATIAGSLQILYGGSVKGDNAAELFSMPDVDGGLVGGASLDAEQVARICTASA